MQIEAITGSYGSQGVEEETLTEEQKSTLAEILAKYDLANMSEEDHRALMDELREAEIPRCAEAGKIMREAGLTPPPPPQGAGGPPPSMAGGEEEENELLTLLEQFKAGEITESELLATLQQYAEDGRLTPGNLVDELA